MTDTNSIYNQLGVSDQVLRFGADGPVPAH